jgi:hypothetical protein
VINKRPSEAGNVTLTVDKSAGFGPATIVRLLAAASNPLEAKSGISLGGEYFDDRAQLAGAPSAEHVPRALVDGRLAWRVYMPRASAALVTILRLF